MAKEEEYLRLTLITHPLRECACLKSFNLFADASGCKNDKQKRQLLLHTAGAAVHDIFYTLNETGNDYKTTVDKLNQYFAPRKNTFFNRHKFR